MRQPRNVTMGKSRPESPVSARRQRHVKLLESMIAGSAPPGPRQATVDGGLEALIGVLRQYPELRITLSLEVRGAGTARRGSVL
jgi:hypothetical protein